MKYKTSDRISTLKQDEIIDFSHLEKNRNENANNSSENFHDLFIFISANENRLFNDKIAVNGERLAHDGGGQKWCVNFISFFWHT